MEWLLIFKRVTYAAFIFNAAMGSTVQAKQGESVKVVTARSFTGANSMKLLQALLAAQNQCISFAYDKNGNRITQTSNGIPSQQPVWGTSAYACFVWS